MSGAEGQMQEAFIKMKQNSEALMAQGQQRQQVMEDQNQDVQQPKQVIQPKIPQAQSRFKKQIIKTPQYIFGQFSEFAVNQQAELGSMQAYIQSLVRQATLSHLQRIKKMVQNARSIKRGSQEQLEQQIQKIVGKGNIYKSIQDPVSFFVAKYNPTTRAKAMVGLFEEFFDFMLLVDQLALVDGQIFQLSKLRLNQSFQRDGNHFIPTTDQYIYIKVGQGRVPITVFRQNGDFLTKSQLFKFNAQSRKIIINMVKLFLADRNLLAKDTNVQVLVGKSVDKIQQQNVA